MAKKQPKTIINNIDSVNVEIDYDKLAQAIVKANKIAYQEECCDDNGEPQKKVGLFKAIVHILKNKQNANGSLLSNSFVVLLTLFFKIIAVVGFLFSLAIIVATIYYLTRSPWNSFFYVASNVVLLLFACSIAFCVFLYSVLMWGAGNDIEKEKDKNYIISVFSGVTGLVALIVALIALFKGVA